MKEEKKKKRREGEKKEWIHDSPTLVAQTLLEKERVKKGGEGKELSLISTPPHSDSTFSRADKRGEKEEGGEETRIPSRP